ncbi:hypothetical protein SNE40_002526 [Patella caerulea]|uniref:Mannosylglycerate hydrolase MGH1-like glycoside hydrolase domain-containing protein n=1 Tax=Patella caerulea TaxID=87958 RepID=A0AAN8KC07_PATCE
MQNPENKRKRHLIEEEDTPKIKKPKEDGRSKDLLTKTTERDDDWELWGPYLSERQWGTVREDYSSHTDSWNYVTYDKAVGYSYKWGEDGLLGWCDRQARMCTSLAVWNGKDDLLKERLFGLSGPQGNHGEDVKELYYYIDSLPDHRYNTALYKYPQSPYPYKHIIDSNKQLTQSTTELELLDTGIFNDGYWDINIEYIKDTPTLIYCKCTVTNHGKNTETLYVLPQVWFRNTWSTRTGRIPELKPKLQKQADNSVDAEYMLGRYRVEFLPVEKKDVDMIFTDNHTSPLYTSDISQTDIDSDVNKFSKDAFHQYIIHGRKNAVYPSQCGTKCAAIHKIKLTPGGSQKICWSIKAINDRPDQNISSISRIEEVLAKTKLEADLFYSKILPEEWSKEEKRICRLAMAGLLWSKQFYYYHVQTHQHEVEKANSTCNDVKLWNKHWKHLKNHDIISVPDKWEFPWYAPWDLAFHMITFSRVDIPFSKNQLLLFLSDRYMKPNGQLPGCEYDMDATNPPLHAWACFKIYMMDKAEDKIFLQDCFHGLLKNFNWWRNSLDPDKCHLYCGGFLGLDNISVIDRTASNLPPNCKLLQSDATGWMAFYCLTLMEIALELSSTDQAYLIKAEMFLDLFLTIADQINQSVTSTGLWDEEDNFFYDVLISGKERKPLKIRSLVGIVPLFACRVIHLDTPSSSLSTKLNSTNRFIKPLNDNRYLISLVEEVRLKDIFNTVFNTQEFLSPYGIRSLSKVYEIPYVTEIDTKKMSLSYCPGESDSNMFGGNSNWRGPVWLPMNYIFMDSLSIYNAAYSDMKLSYPSNSKNILDLTSIIHNISSRIISIFLPDKHGIRPLHGNIKEYNKHGKWEDLILFYEYFNAETGKGCGASHQTGWTSLIVEFIHLFYKTS